MWIFRGNSALYQATKRHLNNSYTETNDEKLDGWLSHLSVFGWAVLFVFSKRLKKEIRERETETERETERQTDR